MDTCGPALLTFIAAGNLLRNDQENFIQVRAFLPSLFQEMFVMGLLKKHH